MRELTFDELLRQFTQLSDEKAYQQAYELVQREAPHFPDHRDYLDYLHMSMAACTKNVEQALHIFRDALDVGIWFSPRWLREKEELQILQEFSAYQEMVAICEQRRAELQTRVKPELVVIEPERETARTHPLFLAHHGNWSNASSHVNNWRRLTHHGWLLALPQSSQVFAPNAYVWDDREKAMQEVQEHYTQLLQQYPVNLDQVILGGFSKGGGLAIWLALSGLIKSCGFVVLGPYIPEADELVPFFETARTQELRGSIVVGEKDKECLPGARKLVDLLHEHGIPCTFEVLPDLAHIYPPDFAQHLEKGVRFVLGDKTRG